MNARGDALLGGAGGALLAAGAAGPLALPAPFAPDDPAPAKTSPPARAAPAARPATDASAALLVGQIYRRAIASVVLIRAGGAEGSGFVIDDRGRIVTNAHVVGGSRRVRVQFGENT